ncbi:hypothetical protein [Pontibacillus marinus]|uniref:DUF3888 domain-containing protein n=1 Tax=Pontibacillus marinus BH030004 = DSM 16465 TaxID=1385511 RepID=A0A0A5GGG4_9BACI|nr:hypothetical protein [Pontibacillus marinus]KGX90205.1 hypothetical protein N783_01550 [Pontibacillus marinus BH030004 = DSM 16465]
MKRVLIIFMTLILFLMNIPIAVNSKKDDFHHLKSYATTHDMFKSLIEPDLTEILHEKLGSNIDWSYNKKDILRVTLVQDKSTPKWYEVHYLINYNNYEIYGERTKGKAVVKLKIIPASFNKEKNSKNEVKLIKIDNMYVTPNM